MTGSGLRFRAATPADLPSIAATHENAFAGFFLARMGQGFLRLYYRLVLEYPKGLLLVAEEDGVSLGFVAGFEEPVAFYEHMARNRRRLYLPTLRAVLRRPSLLPRVLFNRQRVEAGEGSGDPGLCELSSIAVAPEAAGRGLGTALVEAFCDAAAARGCRRVDLTTDADGNDAVNAFYVRCGFALEREFLSGKSRRMNRYARTLGG